MVGTNELIVGGLLVFAIMLVVIVFAVRTSGRRENDVSTSEALPDGDPLVARDEFQATPIAEVIEERVRQKVTDDPSLSGLEVDFGMGVDGGLEIWVNAERYTRVEEVPNETLRAAIREAVEEYNQGL
ncbi:MAG: hypothetical protein P1P76_09585 [Anaerolineales bacterium]|nr:hypothetical protein [Anaerolineales bacterium]